MTDDAKLSQPHRESLGGDFPTYFDKAGSPIWDVLEWARLHENPEYQQILLTDVFSRSGGASPVVSVQTIWDGHDPDFFYGLYYPFRKIFCTGIFMDGSLRDELRWETLEEAWRGHFRMVEDMELWVVDSYSKMNWRYHPRFAAACSEVSSR